MTLKLLISLLAIIICIVVNCRITNKTIKDGVWLEAHGYPKALGAHPLALYLTWLISVAAIYTNLSFEPSSRALVCLPIFFIGVFLQAKIINRIIDKRVAKSKSLLK